MNPIQTYLFSSSYVLPNTNPYGDDGNIDKQIKKYKTMYFDAVKYPRKKKKKIRKIALSEYSFWMSLKAHQESSFDFLTWGDL